MCIIFCTRNITPIKMKLQKNWKFYGHLNCPTLQVWVVAYANSLPAFMYTWDKLFFRQIKRDAEKRICINIRFPVVNLRNKMQNKNSFCLQVRVSAWVTYLKKILSNANLCLIKKVKKNCIRGKNQDILWNVTYF